MPTQNDTRGMTLGYVRVSSTDQRTDRQDLGAVDRTFTDKTSAKDRNRPELDAMVGFAREGDTVVVHSMDRLARSLQDLIGLVQELTGNGVTVRFIKENLTFPGGTADATDPYSTFQMHVLGAVAQLERSLIRERQREGIAKAKERGAYGGRLPALTPDQVAHLRERAKLGVPKAKLARELGVSRTTVFAALRPDYIAR